MGPTVDMQQFQELGYAVIPDLLTPEEVSAIKAMMSNPDGIRKWAYRFVHRTVYKINK